MATTTRSHAASNPRPKRGKSRLARPIRLRSCPTCGCSMCPTLATQRRRGQIRQIDGTPHLDTAAGPDSLVPAVTAEVGGGCSNAASYPPAGAGDPTSGAKVLLVEGTGPLFRPSPSRLRGVTPRRRDPRVTCSLVKSWPRASANPAGMLCGAGAFSTHGWGDRAELRESPACTAGTARGAAWNARAAAIPEKGTTPDNGGWSGKPRPRGRPCRLVPSSPPSLRSTPTLCKNPRCQGDARPRSMAERGFAVSVPAITGESRSRPGRAAPRCGARAVRQTAPLPTPAHISSFAAGPDGSPRPDPQRLTRSAT